MFKSRLSAWGFAKNSRDREYQICACLHKIRKQRGKTDSLFFIHGNKRTLKDLKKYIKGRKMSEDDFVALAEQNVALEQLIDELNVRAVTPPPEGEVGNLGEGSDDGSWHTPPRNAKEEASPETAMPDMQHSGGPALSYFAAEQLTTDALPTHKINSARYRRRSSRELSPLTPQSSHSPSHSITFSDHSPRRPSSSGCPLYDEQDVERMGQQTVYCNSLPQTYGADDLDSLRLLNRRSSDSLAKEYNIICPKCGELVSSHYRSLSRFNDLSAGSNFIPSPTLSQPLNSPISPQPATGPRSLFNPSPDLPAAAPALTIPESSKEHDHSWKWVTFCYFACMQLEHFQRGNGSNQNGEALASLSLDKADQHFEAMITTNDEKIVLTMNQTSMVLQQHDQGIITARIMERAHAVAERCVGNQHPLTALTRMHMLAANPEFLMQHGPEHGITSEVMKHAWDTYANSCPNGINDLRSIGAMYSYAYVLNIESDREKNLENAIRCETILKQCYALSVARLGRNHLQSIQCLINLRLCLFIQYDHFNQGKLDEAITVAEQVVSDSLHHLGRAHPRRLETMRNLAEMLGIRYNHGDIDRAEALYREVLLGRVKMLGLHHQWTLSHKAFYISFLKWQEKWAEDGETSTSEQQEVLDLYDLVMVDSDVSDDEKTQAKRF